MTKEQYGDQLDALHYDYSHLANLVAALQVVAVDIVHLSPGDPIGKDRRDAIIGIGDAMGRIVEGVDKRLSGESAA